jgi:hypothetical protein
MWIYHSMRSSQRNRLEETREKGTRITQKKGLLVLSNAKLENAPKRKNANAKSQQRKENTHPLPTKHHHHSIHIKEEKNRPVPVRNSSIFARSVAMNGLHFV